jgi:hypothetical protein
VTKSRAASTSTRKSPGAAGSSAGSSTGGGNPSGDVTKPQPLSNADQNTGGANGQCPGGPYCSTRDGTASGNGNGGGEAVGKPCAGCVGKADNKNPQGQKPNGSDPNAGYECDRNHGIGRTNPAHTGCRAPVVPPPPPPTTACGPTPANNQCLPVTPPACVPAAGEDASCAAVEGVTTEAKARPTVSRRALPESEVLAATGTSGIPAVTTVGLFLLALGCLAVCAGRRRAEQRR